MLLPAAIGLALACQHSSPGDSATDAESPSTGETTAIARTAEPTGTTDSEESLRTCGAAGEQLLSYQFDAEPDCNVTLGGLHLSDLSFTDLTSISRSAPSTSGCRSSATRASRACTASRG